MGVVFDRKRHLCLNFKENVMLLDIVPKLPMRSKTITKEYYVNRLGFRLSGTSDFEEYLMVQREDIQIHFFLFETLDPKENYGQVYIRTDDIDGFYRSILDVGVPIHPNGPLQVKPWGQKEFSLLDPDNNLLTFGQPVF